VTFRPVGLAGSAQDGADLVELVDLRSACEDKVSDVLLTFSFPGKWKIRTFSQERREERTRGQSRSEKWGRR